MIFKNIKIMLSNSKHEQMRLRKRLFGYGNENCLNLEHHMGLIGTMHSRIVKLEEQVHQLENPKKKIVRKKK